jgi:hypothetical protein
LTTLEPIHRFGMPDLHVVSFDRPWPPSYGGIVDVFWKLATLEKRGVQIRLHYFNYGKQAEAPNPWNRVEAIPYKREIGWKSQFSVRPYIVQSRKNKALWDALSKDNAPILFEGQHCTAWLKELRKVWPKRGLFVRCHNIEFDYYQRIAKASSGWKAFYFKLEAQRLKKQETELRFASALFPLSDKELPFFQQWSEHVILVPPFFRDSEQLQVAGKNAPEQKPYILMQGNYTQPNQARRLHDFLSDFSGFEYELIVAGQGLENISNSEEKSIRCILNPSEALLAALNIGAKAHVLCGEYMGGVPLRMLNALASGKPVWVNRELAVGTGLESWVQLYSRASEINLGFNPGGGLDLADFRTRYSNRASASIIMQAIGIG